MISIEQAIPPFSYQLKHQFKQINEDYAVTT